MKSNVLKKVVFGLVLTTALGTGMAYAYGPQGGPRGDGESRPCWAQEMTEEQQAKAKDLFTKHRATVDPIARELRAKRAELDACMLAVTPDRAKIEAVSQEIGVLKGKLNAERALFGVALQKEGFPAHFGGRGGKHFKGPRGCDGPGWGHGGKHGNR
jgi:P pilus assembly/Cpx signaling pathway, periplasmic inhibitor/zinc-resistance associated protein